MNWEYAVQCLNLALGISLIVRLFRIRLHRIYKLFCAFLIADLFGSVLWILNQLFALFSDYHYLFIWLVIKPVVWLFTLLMVYSLLGKILVQLPGLLRLSRQVLHVVFFLALVVGLVSARYEYSAPGFMALKGQAFITQCWITEMVLDRAIDSTALFSLLLMLGFLFWFPVVIPRNLGIFSVGFSVYFAAMTGLLLMRSFWPNETIKILEEVLDIVNVLIGGVSSACFAFWIFFLSRNGENAPSQLTIQRPPEEQERLIAQLELMNEALLKAGRR